jgi:predicted secreted Zn-dependent protease
MKWTRSSRCEGGSCVEVAVDPNSTVRGASVEVAKAPDGGFLVRSSQAQADVLYFTPEEWDAFVQGVVDHEFDL